MNLILSLVPVTVLAAVVLFLLKEAVEYVRRTRADSRKIHALKALLARECELNFWTIKSLRSILINVPKPDDGNPQIVVRVEKREGGVPVVRITSTDGGVDSIRHIPRAHRELMSKYLLDVATLDKDLFAALEPAYDSVAELEHVRESLIRIEESAGEIDLDQFLGAFSEYAIDELKDAEEALARLYKHCTGKPLEKHRLR